LKDPSKHVEGWLQTVAQLPENDGLSYERMAEKLYGDGDNPYAHYPMKGGEREWDPTWKQKALRLHEKGLGAQRIANHFAQNAEPGQLTPVVGTVQNWLPPRAYRWPKTWAREAEALSEMGAAAIRAHFEKMYGSNVPSKRSIERWTNNLSAEARARVNRGENGPGAKLSWNDVNDIRESTAKKGKTPRELAEEYGVATSTIRRVLANKAWQDQSWDPDRRQYVTPEGQEGDQDPTPAFDADDSLPDRADQIWYDPAWDHDGQQCVTQEGQEGDQDLPEFADQNLYGTVSEPGPSSTAVDVQTQPGPYIEIRVPGYGDLLYDPQSDQFAYPEDPNTWYPWPFNWTPS
jgi:hypothetical protein